MKAVQHIKCINHSWFVLSFELEGGDYQTLCSGDLPIQRARLLELSEGGFPEGVELTLRISAAMGQERVAAERLQVSRNGKTAVFEVTGTSLDFRVTLIEIKAPKGQTPK